MATLKQGTAPKGRYPSRYPAFGEDTGWNDLTLAGAAMPNKEYFSSNAKGGFYDGYEWDDVRKIWIPDTAARQKVQLRLQQGEICPDCGEERKKCICL